MPHMLKNRTYLIYSYILATDVQSQEKNGEFQARTKPAHPEAGAFLFSRRPLQAAMMGLGCCYCKAIFLT